MQMLFRTHMSRPLEDNWRFRNRVDPQRRTKHMKRLRSKIEFSDHYGIPSRRLRLLLYVGETYLLERPDIPVALAHPTSRVERRNGGSDSWSTTLVAVLQNNVSQNESYLFRESSATYLGIQHYVGCQYTEVGKGQYLHETHLVTHNPRAMRPDPAFHTMYGVFISPFEEEKGWHGCSRVILAE